MKALGASHRRGRVGSRSRWYRPRLEVMEDRVLLATFTVTNTDDSGLGSLRQAILDANGNPGLDDIVFNITGPGPHTISPLSALPIITEPVVIDGYSQPGASENTLPDGNNAVLLVELSGVDAPVGTSGLVITAGGSTVQGLVINSFLSGIDPDLGIVGGHGIELTSQGENAVRGNYIGTDTTGTNALGNDRNGVFINNAWNNIIGGSMAGDRNLISGNDEDGIVITGSGATDNLVQGNFIGSDVTGTQSLGNNGSGVAIFNALDNTIGGTEPGAGNIIGGATRSGILITGDQSSNNLVQGNFIGTNTAGDNLGNTFAGVEIGDPNLETSVFNANNQVGGVDPGAGNVIAFNGAGVVIFTGVGNAILGNSIFANTRAGGTNLGIDLGGDGVTPLSSEGPGPNNFQNFPVLTSVVSLDGTTTIQGTLNSATVSTYRIEFFNDQGNPSGFGEGQTFLGFMEVTTDEFGQASFTFEVPTPSPALTKFTATATLLFDDDESPLVPFNTSEFSEGFEAEDPDVVEFSAASFNVVEGDGFATITVTRTGFLSTTVTVDVATSDDTAIAGVDYLPVSTTLTFDPGVAEQSFNVTILDNDIDQLDRTLFLTLSDPTGNSELGTIVTATLTIIDDDFAFISIADTSVVEGDVGTVDALFTVTLATPSDRTITVQFATSNGTAIAGQDYVATSGTITFAPGQTEQTIAVPVIGNLIDQLNRTFFVNLSNAIHGGVPDPELIERATATGTIIDDDFAFISIADTSVVEGDVGTVDALFTVTLATPSDRIITVTFATANGTGIAGRDYVATSGTLTFEPGQTEQIIAVPVIGNIIHQPDRTFFVNLSNAVHGGVPDPELIERSTATGTIIDDDLVFVSIDDVAVPEGDIGFSFATFTVTLSNPSVFPIFVDFATMDGTATAWEDYFPVAGTLAFAPGETSHTITVAIIGDLLIEGDETFFVVVQPARTNGEFIVPGAEPVIGTGTILDDDSLTVINTNDAGFGSLRQAILVANANPGQELVIDFDIPGAGVQVIQPGTALPQVLVPVVIDGFSQPGSRPNTLPQGNDAVVLIALDGALLEEVVSGLVLTGGESVVQGLAITRFPVAGLVLAVGGGNVIQGNFIGTDPTGTLLLGNGADGIFLIDSSNNVIGGTVPEARNVISGNRGVGIQILGNVPIPLGNGTGDDVEAAALFFNEDATGNQILGNYIGTDASGTQGLGNAFGGIFINNASRNTVGGTTPEARNVISGNGLSGIQIFDTGAFGNVVQGNFIGTDVTGTQPLGNAFDGVFINNASGNLIGGATPGAGNVISANGSVGVQFFGPGAFGNVVQGNTIGADVSGTRPLGNRADGVFINGAPNNLIGGVEPGAGNLITANGFSGIDIDTPGATGNVVQGNTIVANLGFGILIENASGNVIGGDAPNTIALNQFGGIVVVRGGQFISGPGGNQLLANNVLLNDLILARSVVPHARQDLMPVFQARRQGFGFWTRSKQRPPRWPATETLLNAWNTLQTTRPGVLVRSFPATAGGRLSRGT